MEDRLIELLEEFDLPVIRQGSLDENDKYPDSFFTFWNPDSADHAHYDNSEYGIRWEYDVYFYSTDPLKTYSILEQARIKLKVNGWIITGRGFDVDSDEITHTGRGFQAYYLQTT